MKIFKNVGYSGNINYLDKNGFAVGWGGGGECCADGGEFFSKECDLEGGQLSDFNPEQYSFNPDFLKELVPKDGFDSGGSRAFELVNDNDPTDKVYLIVYNWHNGYYSTSLEIKKGDKVILDESL